MVRNDTDDMPAAQALAQGRREGLATAALAMGLLAFVNLLGLEKGLLTLVLGWLALRGPIPAPARRKATIAIALALLQLATVALVLAVFHDKLVELLRLLHQLG
jgi:hypothetical protein